jgi:hypothetical protein
MCPNWQKKDSAPPKQALPTIPVLKCGQDKNTAINATFGHLDAFSMSYALSKFRSKQVISLLSTVGSPKENIQRSLLNTQIK